MSHLEKIFAVWEGNAEALARDIGVSGHKVRQWRHRKSIPSRYWEAIIEAASKLGVTLEWTSFRAPVAAGTTSGP